MENSPIDQAFASVDEAYEFLKREQADQGFVISKSKSYRDRKDPKIQGRTIIQCQQSGPYRAFKVQKGKYMASTKKTNCPFNAIIKFNRFFNTFHITITDSTHNHNPIEFPLGSSRLRQLSQTQFSKERIIEMVENRSKSGQLTSKEIARQIRVEHPEVLIDAQDVSFIR